MEKAMSLSTSRDTLSLIPILIIFTLVCYPVEMAYLSETSLGKFFCVTLILWYGVVDPIYGAFVCALVILYYQFGYLDHVLSVNRNILIQESMSLVNASLANDIPTGAVAPEILQNLESYTTRDATVFSYESVEPALTPDESVLLDKDPKRELKAAFRKENCRNGRLGVNNELAEHVAFPMSGNAVSIIKFNTDFAKCNPCDPNCGFSIVEERLLVEDALATPADSHNTTNLNPAEWFKDVEFRPFDSMMDDFQRWGNQVNDFISHAKIPY
jgi:hypothetical protein